MGRAGTVGRLAVVLPLALAAGVASAQSSDGQGNEDEARSPLFGPKLLYYPLECHDVRGCRLDCFQNGVNVVSRINISQHDAMFLVVNAGISDEIVPRWIEIRPFDDSQVQTVLLEPGALCDFQSISIKPLPGP